MTVALTAFAILILSLRIACMRARLYFITGVWPVVKVWDFAQPRPMRILSEPILVQVTDNDRCRAEEVARGGAGQPHRAGAGDVHRGSGGDARADRTVVAGRKDVREHGEVADLLQRLVLVREFEQVEVGVGD